MPPADDFDPYAVLQVVPGAEQEVVNAAFKALARKYHPDYDATQRAAQKMAELNRAYTLLRDEASRRVFDRGRRVTIAGVSLRAPARTTPVQQVRAGPNGSTLNFGRYAGWGLADLARHDPDYLLWLSRHSSGIRYRTEIYGILRTMGLSAA